MVWETVFLLVILKIPIVYLVCVIWWAVRSEPTPPDPPAPAAVTAPIDPEPRPGWRFLRGPVPSKRPRRGPHGSPRRAPRRTPLPASWLAAGWKADE